MSLCEVCHEKLVKARSSTDRQVCGKREHGSTHNALVRRAGGRVDAALGGDGRHEGEGDEELHLQRGEESDQKGT